MRRLAAAVARSLETGSDGALVRAGADVWGRVASRSLVKALTFRASARIIAIGGATLGGSGKTSLAMACAALLADAGERVAFVGHAYRAEPGRARLVGVRDALSLVGDEALLAARQLATHDVPVVVGPTRQGALDRALHHADVAILDGVLQLRPVPAHLSLLALDATAPWGAGACPPAGDLRAPRDALLHTCDRVVIVGEGATADAEVTRSGAWLEGRRLSWDELRPRRLGLVTYVARPARVVAALYKERITPRVVVAHEDHGDAATPAHPDVDLWLCTPKCAVRVPPRLGGAPVAVLDHHVHIGDPLAEALLRLVGR